MSSSKHARELRKTLERIEEAKVIAILRAKNYQAALVRGQELVNLGCRSIEVTTDSVDFESLLRALVQRVGDRCVVGVGTITNPKQLKIARRCGAKFALSPVNPKEWDFIGSCHDLGVLAVPAAFSPQEIHEAVSAGAMCVKVFPAQLWTPSKFKSLRGIGEFGKMCLIPSGGISPETADEWLASGASAVGMGSNLVGKDIRIAAKNTRELRNHREEWARHGRVRARKLFERMKPVRSML